MQRRVRSASSCRRSTRTRRARRARSRSHSTTAAACHLSTIPTSPTCTDPTRARARSRRFLRCGRGRSRTCARGAGGGTAGSGGSSAARWTISDTRSRWGGSMQCAPTRGRRRHAAALAVRRKRRVPSAPSAAPRRRAAGHRLGPALHDRHGARGTASAACILRRSPGSAHGRAHTRDASRSRAACQDRGVARAIGRTSCTGIQPLGDLLP